MMTGGERTINPVSVTQQSSCACVIYLGLITSCIMLLMIIIIIISNKERSGYVCLTLRMSPTFPPLLLGLPLGTGHLGRVGWCHEGRCWPYLWVRGFLPPSLPPNPWPCYLCEGRFRTPSILTVLGFIYKYGVKTFVVRSTCWHFASTQVLP